VVGDLPVTALVDECPAYDLEPAAPSVPLYDAPPRLLEDDLGPKDTLVALMGSANVASRRPVFEQYDCVVGSRTARRPEQADAAVLMLAEDGDRRPALAVSIDGNGRRVAVDPYRGAVEAVLECSANLACVGAEPLGLTNCLNFGNPEKPHIAWQLTRAVAGLSDACRALGVPVVGGNVSLYNEGGGGPIYPTPVVGMVGELPDAARSGRLGFAHAGDAVALIAARGWAPSLTGSELAKLRGEAPAGELPAADLGELRTLHTAVRQAVRSGALRSAHDVAEGGLAVALAECCVASGLGAEVTVDTAEHVLFGEGPGAFLVSGPHDAFAAFGEAATVIGVVGGDELRIADTLAVGVDELAGVHADGLAVLMR
jgi:phosphoribosylformylglycinamidine synthase